MAYFKIPSKESIFNNNAVAFNIGEYKDTYSIMSNYWHDIENDTISHQHEVVKNRIS